MEHILKLKCYINIVFVVMLVLISLTTNPKNLFADDIEKFASKLFHHYEYDDKITNYLKSIFSFSNSNKNKISKSKSPTKYKKQNSNSIKLKSKDKMIYNFKNGQSLQINPSNIEEKIIFNNTTYSYLEIRENGFLYGINIDF